MRIAIQKEIRRKAKIAGLSLPLPYLCLMIGIVLTLMIFGRNQSLETFIGSIIANFIVYFIFLVIEYKGNFSFTTLPDKIINN